MQTIIPRCEALSERPAPPCLLYAVMAYRSYCEGYDYWKIFPQTFSAKEAAESFAQKLASQWRYRRILEIKFGGETL